jgi:selenocysteine-specific elongation factor
MTPAARKNLVVGVVGHVDHGKTALVRALTGMDTDRLEEEKRRGISIALGFAHFAAADTGIDLIDMPGHERFVRTMVSGATGIDAVLVVVAANEGIKPQTREHLDICALLGLTRAVVAISKCDIADAKAAKEATLSLCRSLGIDVLAAVETSAITAQGVPALRNALAAAAIERAPDADGFAYLPIDRVFSLAGHGTIVTGTLRRNALAITDEIAIALGDRPVRLRGLQIHGARVTVAQPGQRVAANLRDIEPGDIAPGAALTARGLLPASRWLTVQLRAVKTVPPLATGALLKLLFGTEEMQARLRLLDRDELAPGETALAQLHGTSPVAVPAREHFVLRRASPPLTLAGGHIIDPAATRQRRHAPASLARLAALAHADPPAILALELESAGAAGVALARLSQLAGLSHARTAALLQGLPCVLGRSRVAILRPAYERILAAIPAALAPAEDGIPAEKIARLLPWAGPAVLDDALAELAGRGAIQRAGGTIRLPTPQRDRDRAAREAAAAAQIAEALRRAGLSPPDPSRVAEGPAGKRLLDRLVREGVAVRALDVVQKRELIFHAEAIETAKRRLAPLLATPPGLRVGEAGAALGISRKYCVPLLEHLDAIRFTRRIADRRMLARNA